MRGFNSRKLHFISDVVSRDRYDVVFLQETMISSDDLINSFSSQWPGSSFWSPSIGRRAGVAVLFSPSFDGEIISWKRDSDGRLISLCVKYGSVNFNLVNVYAPTALSERNEFIQSIHEYFLPRSKLILAGDFNCYDDRRDKFGGNVSICKELSHFKSAFNLIDIWRSKHPRVTQCSWFNSDFSIGSRLDYFFASSELAAKVSCCEISPCAYSDHDFVALKIDASAISQIGPSVWKFNNSLLADDSFCSFIRLIIHQHIRFKHAFSSVKEFWESLKDTIKSETIKFSSRKKRALLRDQVLLTKQLSVLKNLLVTGVDSVRPEIRELEASLNALLITDLNGVKVRSRAKWIEEGELPTRYFFKLQQQRFVKSRIESICNSDDVEVFSHEEIMKAHVDFYANLFSRDDINEAIQRDLLSNVSRRLPESDCASCEGDLCLAEATTAVNGMANNKSPGLDGLSSEFYKKFWDLLGPLLVEVFNVCLTETNLCESMKTSATRLVFKKGDRKLLKNWRPISLLNVDYKICSRALSLRLSKVLETIVDPDQTCSVPGRSITSNLVLLRDTLEYIERTNETGILVSLDQEKAFDRVDRTFLMNLLCHFGFGPSFCNWISTLYFGANMRIFVNGWLTGKVDLQRGVRQGDSLSPMLYILCVEVLACAIRKSPDIEGFLLPGARGGRFKVSQYADDTTGYLRDFRSLRSLFDVISLYERGTGAKLNVSKSEAMWLGAWRERTDQPLGLSWVRKMKVLGVVFGTVNVERDNWEPRLSKLDKCLNMWKSRSLSMIGKAWIVNILAISKLLYVAAILVPPDWVLAKFNQLLWSFLWGSKIEPVARKSLHCPVSKGGLGIFDFVVKGQALRLSAMFQAISNPEFKCFYLLRYFCGARLARLRSEWVHLRDNSAPNAESATPFYSRCIATLSDLSHLPSAFIFSSKNIYRELLKRKSSPPILPLFWAPFVGRGFDLQKHWSNVRESLTENFKNDLLWLITLKAVKVRDSLRSWGYIASDRCACCSRKETIDHCFLNCARAKAVWAHFVPLLSGLISSRFSPNCSFVFFFKFSSPSRKGFRIALYVIKTVLYAIWKFRNRSTFHNGSESSGAIIKYVKQNLKSRIKVDFFRLSRDKFVEIWAHDALLSVDGGSLLFAF